jgi:hypothetical protein
MNPTLLHFNSGVVRSRFRKYVTGVIILGLGVVVLFFSGSGSAVFGITDQGRAWRAAAGSRHHRTPE